MKEGILDLINNVIVSNFVSISIFFQHPSPSGDNSSRQALARAGDYCVTALLQGKVHAVCVFNVFEGRN